MICKVGTLEIHLHTKPTVLDFSLLFHAFDETKSWYLQENLEKYCTPPCEASTDDPWYHTSNTFAGSWVYSYHFLHTSFSCIYITLAFPVSDQWLCGRNPTRFDGCPASTSEVAPAECRRGQRIPRCALPRSAFHHSHQTGAPHGGVQPFSR